MVLQRIKYFFTKNPLDLLNYEDLQSDRIRCEQEIKNLHERITAVEKEIDIYWAKAKESKSPSDERAIAERINTESQKRDYILKKIADAETTLRTVEEFINKIEEKNKKRATDPLTRRSQSDLEDLLTKISVYEEGVHQQAKTLMSVTEPKTDTVDDNVNEILQAIKATKRPETYSIEPDKEPASPQSKELEPDS